MTELPKRSRPSRNELLERKGRSNIIFVTVATHNREPLLVDPGVHHALRNAWKQADHWFVGKYVILPDHLHLFCAPATFPPSSLRMWIRYWKRLTTQAKVFGRSKDIWQRDCWDTQIRSGRHYTEKWQYIQENPVRAKLVQSIEDWPLTGELTPLDWREP
ncbi:REP-associated tyrosine transposase [Coraliomargarita akajimensis]|uniref:Transposase IS200-like domain-containing protein n=1 Tax=Coraliomargarita akajimensis (strain DSM 45221 / IAM 15411 / JCM 23193 / KCTC 12865 / 04OKA010-24) TaxID=583355 RepID=D5EL56_CORAD|nr:hypothetical protein Caka_0129 [Coraliomargarita akajimensis DSM 45221]